MSMALLVIGCALLLNGIYQMVKYLIITSELRSDSLIVQTNPRNHKFHRFIILVPVLHEEKTIRTFLHDLSFQDYPKEFFETYIITTQKEYLSGPKYNTINIVSEILAENTLTKLQINKIHYPNSAGFKTDQLDFAFDQIRKNFNESEMKETYFLFLDADSELDTATLTRFNNSIEAGIEIYQQPLLWFKNIDVIKDPIMRCFAFSQSYFSISYEIPMYTERFFPYRLKYFVGHGLCIKGSFLIRTNGLPKIIEDVRLGRLSSFLKYKTRLVPGFGIVETAKDLPTYIKQSSIWFFGCGLFISDYTQTRHLREDNHINLRDIILLTYGFFKAFRWLNKGLFHLTGIILALYFDLPQILFLYIVSLLINSSFPVILVAINFKKLLREKLTEQERRLTLFHAVIFAPVLYMINFLGLYYGLIKLFKYYLWGKISLPKTER